jgi:type I restriction enzyme S subunit
MELKPGYKQTELGVIPEEWDVRACAEVCVKIQDGTHFSPSLGGDDYLYITSKNIGFGVLDVLNADRINAAQHKAIYKRCDVRHGDLLLTKDGANTGNVALNTLEGEFSLLSSVAFLRFDPKRHAAGYFLQQILSNPVQRQIKDAMVGNAITRLTLEKIRKLRLSVPPLPEQRAIAGALEDMDALLGALERLIVKKRDLKQAAMQQLLTGRKRLHGFGQANKFRQTEIGLVPEDWSVSTFKNLFDITAGGDVDPERSKSYQDETYCFPIYSNALTNRGLYGYCSYANHLAGSITITARGTLGVAKFRDHAYTAIGRVLVLLPKGKLDGRFFADIINNRVKFAIESTGVPQLTAPQISTYMLPVPSFPEQTAIANVLSDMDTEIAALEQRSAKTHALKQGMMQELLTGRVRLI